MGMRQFGGLAPARQMDVRIRQICGQQLNSCLGVLCAADLGDKDCTAADTAQILAQWKLSTNYVTFPLLPGFNCFTDLHHLTFLSGLLYASLLLCVSVEMGQRWKNASGPCSDHG